MIYQEQEALFTQKRKPAAAKFATVVWTRTVGDVEKYLLRFDGETEATKKAYKSNAALSLTAGDRVRVNKVSGTYVIEYKL